MNVSQKRLYLVEATGGIVIKKQKYSASDPDEASYLAFRHEAFYRMQIRYPNCSPQQAMNLIEDGKIDMPDFKICKISLVSNEVKK